MKTSNPLRKVALLGGMGYLIIFITGIFANFFILESLVEQGSAQGTAENMMSNPLELCDIWCSIISLVRYFGIN